MKNNSIFSLNAMFLLGFGLLIGLVPALCMSVQEGTLFFLGQPVASGFEPSRYPSALFSFLSPFAVFLPLFAYFRGKGTQDALVWSLLAPVFLYLPGLAIWMLKTGQWSGRSYVALVLVCLLCFNLSLWLIVSSRWLKPASLFLFWPLSWGLGTLLAYVHSYIQPYSDSPVFGVMDAVYVLLPPLAMATTWVPDLLNGQTFLGLELWVIGGQSLVLGGLIGLWHRRTT